MMRPQHLAAIHLVCVVVVLIAHRRFRSTYRLRDRDMMRNGKSVQKELFHYLSISGSYRKHIRMSENAFNILCQKLKSEGGLRPTQRMSVEEQVIKFLHLVGHDVRISAVSLLYRRSESAINRDFHKVLNAIISLENQYIRQRMGDVVQKEIQEKNKFYPYFKDCIGAIDGTHVRVRVSNKEAPRYRGRKGYPTINALVACTFDLKFTYVLSGWEGTTSDSRIIKDAPSRDDKLVIPNGKFYLVDGGLPHRSTLIAPYRGVRYHLKEYSSRAPHNPRELFNLRHASLRNAIERAFGLLKKRFAIIRSSNEPFYPPETQSDIFLSGCILHNLRHEKPEAAKWKTKEICHYDDLRQLFAKDRASGTSAVTAKERRKQIENEQRVETIQEVDQLLETNEVTLEKPITPDETQGTTPLSQPKLPTISKGKKKRNRRWKKKKVLRISLWIQLIMLLKL